MSAENSREAVAQYIDDGNLNARLRLHRRYTPPGEDMLDVIWSRYQFSRGARVLDVGCGNGTFWRHPVAPSALDLDLTLVDASPGMLAAARESLDGHLEATFEQADASDLPFDDNAFDAVLAHFMLYHVEDKKRALAEFARVTRDWCGIVLLGPGSMVRVFDLLQEIDPSVTLPVSDADRFTSDDAAPMIEGAFARVETTAYEYTMAVTDAADLLAYVQSSGFELSTEHWQAYERRVEDEIRREGSFGVRKRCTLFKCFV